MSKQKYKVGDEVLVKVKILSCDADGFYEVTNVDNSCKNPQTIRRIFVNEKHISDMTAEETWEIAREISKMDAADILEYILDKNAVYPIRATFCNYSPQEVKVKLESLNKIKEEKEIKIGDEVVPKSCVYDNTTKFFVTHIHNKEIISGYSGFSGEVFSGRDMRLYQKTGRHIELKIQGH